MLSKIKALMRKEVEWPVGLASLSIFVICLVSYYFMSPFFGSFQVPTILLTMPEDVSNWMLWVIKMGFLSGFWHGDLSHLMYNMVVTLPCMLVIEKRRGPLEMICLYLVMSVVGSIFLFHMVGGIGIGSSCVTFGLAVAATRMLTKGASRLLLLVPIVVMLIEAAKWWMGILGDNTAHLGHVGGMVVGFLYCLSAKDE